MSFAYGLEKIEPAFEDRPVPYIAYGARFHELTATHLNQTLAAERVYIIASTSLSTNTPSLSQLENAIKENCPSTKLVGTHIGIPPHTPWDTVMEITNKARTAFADKPLTEHDILITLGGGSLTDGAKIIAWLLSNPQIKTTTDLDTVHAASPSFSAASLTPPIIRVITIPTTLSGGEYSSIAGASRSDTTSQKCLFTPPLRNPSLVILDPALTTTTPAPIYLSTGVRAIDHCIETLCSLSSTVAADESADAGLKALIPGLLATKTNSQDLNARFGAMQGVKHAMSAVSAGVPLGGSHAIGHQLGPLGVGHGETSCIMLPAVCKYNAAHNANIDRQAICRDVLIQIAEVRDLVTKSGKMKLEDADLGDLLDLVVRALGLPRSLKDVGVGRDRLDGLARNTLSDHWAGTNPVPLVRKEQVLEILEMVVG